MSNFVEKQTNCPICNSSDLRGDLKIHYWRENLLNFSDCTRCGASFANPMPSDSLISQGNSALVRLYQNGRSEEQELREARQAYLRGKLFAQKLSRIKKKGRVLELGCYHGFFSLGIHENSDWNVEGLEISEELCYFIRNTLGLTCHLGTLENSNLSEGAYDYVICHDLIEHINQPKVFINKLSTILAPGGQVEIITPNAIQDLAFARRASAKGTPITMLLNHIMYFAPSTLRTALEGAGLQVQKLYCYDVRYSYKDFNWFGLGEKGPITQGPSMHEALALTERKTLSIWNPTRLGALREDPKVSLTYGFFRETLPKALRWRVPPGLGIGHEIYAVARKE